MSAKRIKDAGFLQQHFEKLVLLGGVVVFLIAVFLFVISKPFAVEVNRQTYPEPEDAIDVLVRIDKDIEAGLQETQPLPETIIPEFSADFIAMMQRPVDLQRTVADLGDPGKTQRAVYPLPPKVSRYALVYPPAPKDITYKVGTDVLDKEFLPDVGQEFFALWNKEWDEPGDFTMFVAAGEFDIWEWVTRLQADPAVQGEIKIPNGIWTQRLGIAGVALLRETFDFEKGEWSERQIVVPMPGQVRVMPSDKAESEMTLALNKLAELRDMQLQLAQPEMPWLKGFVQVAPPGNEDEGNADGFIQGVGKENLGPAELEILNLEEKIRLLEERRTARDQRQQGGSPRPGDIDRPDSRPDRSDRPERRDRIAEQIQALRDKITRLQPQAQKDAENRERLAELERRRDEVRRRREALRLERGGLGEPEEGAGIEGLDLDEDSTLRIWAADPSMQPGKTYRYKLIVSVINPLYAVPRLAEDQLSENLNRAAIMPTEAEINAMQWIGPIKVEPETRFFFTSGRGSTAKIDIFRRFDGELRLQEFEGGPGDYIGSVEEFENQDGQVVEIDMNVGAIIVDIEQRRDLLSNTTVTTLIYADKDGNIFERTDVSDKNSPDRKAMRGEISDGPEQTLRPAEDADPANLDGPGAFEPGLDF